MLKKIWMLLVIVVILTGCQKNYYNPDETNDPKKPLIALSADALTIEIGDVSRIFAAVYNTDAKVLCESGNPEIVAVSGEGELLAKEPGKVLVTAKTEDGEAKAVCEVTVTPLRTVAFSGEVPELSAPDISYTIGVTFYNCTYPSVKVIADCGSGEVAGAVETKTFGNEAEQIKVVGDTEITFSIDKDKPVNTLRVLCYDNGDIVDTKEFSIKPYIAPPFKKAAITGNIPTVAEPGNTFTVSVNFENCAEPKLKIVADNGGGKVTAGGQTVPFGAKEEQFEVYGNAKISFTVSDVKDCSRLRLVCFDGTEVIDVKEYTIQKYTE